MSHQYGKQERIFCAGDKVEVCIEPLSKILLHPNVENRKIVLFSLIGTYRQGKSFFLDYCLRFLYANYQSINNPENTYYNPNGWIGNKNDPLVGFSWKPGADRDTTGIIIWNDVFLHTDERTGDKIAIIVMDTQGLFDSDTSTVNNSRIFALATLLSSIQVFNLTGLIHENMLQYLQFATEFAKFTMSDDDNCSTTPFQSLLFLIRDWKDEVKHAYGITGGQDYLKNYLEIKSTSKDDLKYVRESINESFEKLSCCLLPDPGKTVTTNQKNRASYNGCWGEMDETFRNELFCLIEHILIPDNLVMKKINGDKINGKQFLVYVEKYFKNFQSDQLPEAKTIFKSTVETQLNSVMEKSFIEYKDYMYSFTNKSLTETDAQTIHENAKKCALEMYDRKKKMGSINDKEDYKILLIAKIDTYFNEWKDVNENNLKLIEEENEKARKRTEERERKLNDQLAVEKTFREMYEKLQREHKEEIHNIFKENNKGMLQLQIECNKNIAGVGKTNEYLASIIEKKLNEDAKIKILEERLENERKRSAKKKAKKEKIGFFEKVFSNVGSAADSISDKFFKKQ